MNKQSLNQKLLQKLSPQQIKLMKLIQLSTLELENRIDQEIELNPALENKSELDELQTNLDLGESKGDGWADWYAPTGAEVWSGRVKIEEAISTIKYLLHVVNRDGISKLDTKYKDFTICVYCNLELETFTLNGKKANHNSEYRKLFQYIQKELENHPTEEDSYLKGQGSYGSSLDFAKVINWSTPANSTDYTENYTKENSDTIGKVRFFTNYKYSPIDNSKQGIFSYGPKYTSKKINERRLVNKSNLIMRLLKNSPFDKTIYIDPNVKVLSEGVHNYLFRLLDTYHFIFSPKLYGDRIKGDDLYDGFTLDIVGNNRNHFKNDTDDTNRKALFN